MTKQILIVRHAKSDWGNAQTPDFDRPLNSRGEKNAPEMAKRLFKKGLIPQQIVSSPARRAFTTAKYFAKELGLRRAEILTEPEIYEASTSTLVDIVNKFDNRYSFTALFGHNPGITSLVKHLCNEDLYNVPTCGVILIEFPFDDWALVSGGTGVLKLYDYPKNGDD